MKQDFIKIKSQIIRSIRSFFDNNNFLEVDTPTLVKSPDPSIYHEVFELKNLNNERLFLITSPEFYLKKLISQGYKNIYQITKVYRDSVETDPFHSKEFTMIEWYRDNADYLDLMTDCERLVTHIRNVILKTKSEESLGGSFSAYQRIRMTSTPWPRISCSEAFLKHAKVDLNQFINLNNARKISQQKGYRVNPTDTWEQLYHQIFLNEVEPELIKLPAFFLYDYPIQLAELSQAKKDNPNFAERFELYLNGLEIGNGYSELTDWQEQEKRLKNDVQQRKEKNMKVFDYDHELISALKKGLPKTAGIAIGIDRLIMALTGEKDIKNINPFSC